MTKSASRYPLAYSVRRNAGRAKALRHKPVQVLRRTPLYQFQITVDIVRELPRKAPSSQRGNWIDLANLRPVFDAVALEDISLVDMIDEELVSITQLKTGRKIRIENEGELTKVLARIRSRVRRPGVRTLIVNEHGEAFTPGMFKKRFNKAREAAGVQFQLRDLRAKNATDTDDLALAQKRLAHASRAMTEHYVRQRLGEKVKPLNRKITGD